MPTQRECRWWQPNDFREQVSSASRERYRLTSKVPALRERELVGVSRYQLLFTQHLSTVFPPSEDGQRRAELFSAGIVAAHNRVLRRWLRGDDMDPQVEIDGALSTVRDTFEHAHGAPEPVVVVLPASMKTSELGARIVSGARVAPPIGRAPRGGAGERNSPVG